MVRFGEAVEGAVHRVGQEADEDVGLHSMFGLVEDGADGEILLEGSEGGLSVVELHVHGPQLGLIVAGEVGAEEVGAFGVPKELALRLVLGPGELERVAIALDMEAVGAGDAGALELEAAEALVEHVAAVQPTRVDGVFESDESLLNPLLEAVVDRSFLLTAVR